MENGSVQAAQGNSDIEKRHQSLKDDFEAFAYTVSHDLREPVRMVRSFMELLEKKYAEQLDEKAKSYIHFAKDGALRLDQMVMDLLEFYRSVRPGERVKFDMAALIRGVAESLQENHQNFIVRCSELSVMELVADKTAWKHIFRSILSDVPLFFVSDVNNIVEISNSSEKGLVTEIRVFNVKNDLSLLEQSFKLFNKAGLNPGENGYRKGWAIARRIIQHWGGQMEARLEDNVLIIYFKVIFT